MNAATRLPTAGLVTMNGIVQDGYGTAPEEVLRLGQVARPSIAGSMAKAASCFRRW